MSLVYNLLPFVTEEDFASLKTSYTPLKAALPKDTYPIVSQQSERVRQALVNSGFTEEDLPLNHDFEDPIVAAGEATKAFGKYILNTSDADVCFQSSVDGKDDMLTINGYGTGIYWDRTAQVVCVLPTMYENSYAVFQFDLTQTEKPVKASAASVDGDKPKRVSKPAYSYGLKSEVKEFWIISTKLTTTAEEEGYLAMDTYEIEESEDGKIKLVHVDGVSSNDDEDDEDYDPNQEQDDDDEEEDEEDDEDEEGDTGDEDEEGDDDTK